MITKCVFNMLQYSFVSLTVYVASCMGQVKGEVLDLTQGHEHVNHLYH